MDIRRATDDDHIGVWEIMEPVFQAGDTYTIDADISRDDALAYWFDVQKQTFVAEADGQIIGTCGTWLRGGACNVRAFFGPCPTHRISCDAV